MEVQSIIVLAFLVEAIWTNLRMIWDKNKFNWNNLGALVVAILVAVATGVDIFPAIGISVVVPYVGSILTGILVSRGANVIFDLLKKINLMLAGKTEEIAETVPEVEEEQKSDTEIVE